MNPWKARALGVAIMAVPFGYLWLLGWLIDHHPHAWYTIVAALPLLVAMVVAHLRDDKGKRKR